MLVLANQQREDEVSAALAQAEEAADEAAQLRAEEEEKRQDEADARESARHDDAVEFLDVLERKVSEWRAGFDGASNWRTLRSQSLLPFPNPTPEQLSSHADIGKHLSRTLRQNVFDRHFPRLEETNIQMYWVRSSKLLMAVHDGLFRLDLDYRTIFMPEEVGWNKYSWGPQFSNDY